MIFFISAVAFATILAVVSGLTLAGASAISHDIYANVINPNASDEKVVKISKITVIIVGIVGVTLGITFESQNIAYMVGLAFGIAASANFPILFLSIYWSKLTTRGAFIGGNAFLGFISAVAFATILAVVSGLTLAGASAISHDMNAHIVTGKQIGRAHV